jgi:hypothetical protein
MEAKLMIQSNQKVFLQRAVQLALKSMAKQGIILLRTEDLELALLQVGQLYYEMEKQEELE